MLGKPLNSFKNSKLISCNYLKTLLVCRLDYFTFTFPELYTTLMMFISSDSFFECFQGSLVTAQIADFLAQGIKMYSLFVRLQIQI